MNKTISTTIRSKMIGAGLLAGTLLFTACGAYGDDNAAPTEPATQVVQDGASAAGGAEVVDDPAPSAGDFLVDGRGFSLYGFLQDENGEPSCFGGCAEVWPAVLVGSAELPTGLDPTVFSVAQRQDGQFQLRAGKWPLYTFAGDEQAGDTNGQGSGGVWFLARPDGTLIGTDA